MWLETGVNSDQNGGEGSAGITERSYPLKEDEPKLEDTMELTAPQGKKDKEQHAPQTQQQQPDHKQFAYRPKIHKREKITDTHTSQAYMIEKELIDIIDDIVGDAWGGKYRFVLMIYQEFPEYANRIRVKEYMRARQYGGLFHIPIHIQSGRCPINKFRENCRRLSNN